MDTINLKQLVGANKETRIKIVVLEMDIIKTVALVTITEMKTVVLVMATVVLEMTTTTKTADLADTTI